MMDFRCLDLRCQKRSFYEIAIIVNCDDFSRRSIGYRRHKCLEL